MPFYNYSWKWYLNDFLAESAQKTFSIRWAIIHVTDQEIRRKVILDSRYLPNYRGKRETYPHSYLILYNNDWKILPSLILAAMTRMRIMMMRQLTRVIFLRLFSVWLTQPPGAALVFSSSPEIRPSNTGSGPRRSPESEMSQVRENRNISRKLNWIYSVCNQPFMELELILIIFIKSLAEMALEVSFLRHLKTAQRKGGSDI